MRIAIDARKLRDFGIGTYIRNILIELSRLDQATEYILDRLCIHGSVDRVVDQILALREEIGDFGELVYAGMDWVDEGLTKRSMQLMAEQVMPRVNAAIAGGRRSAAAGG